MSAWWQHIWWSMPRTGLSQEPTSARIPLRQRCSLQLNSIFQESFLRTSLDAVVRYPDQIRCYVNPPAPLPLYSPRSFPRSRDKRWFQRYCYLTASTKLLLRLQKAAELQTILIVIFWFLFSFPFRTFPKSMLCYPIFRIPSNADVCKVFPEKKGDPDPIFLNHFLIHFLQNQKDILKRKKVWYTEIGNVANCALLPKWMYFIRKYV